MDNFLELFIKNNKKNSGDDLLGFRIDLDYFLEESNCFDYFEIHENPNNDYMFEIEGTLLKDLNINEAIIKIEDTWNNNLRYSEYESHKIENFKDGFVFYFVTFTKELGISGKIVFNK